MLDWVSTACAVDTTVLEANDNTAIIPIKANIDFEIISVNIR